MEIKTFVIGSVQTNCYVVWDENKNCVIIDCDGNGSALIDFLEKEGLKLCSILLTHGHFDHIGALAPLKQKYPEAEILIGKGDMELLENPKRGVEILADKGLKQGDSIEAGSLLFEVLETPGHTLGGVCYICGDALFSGDTLFRGDCGRVDLYGGDWGQMQHSLKKLALIEGNKSVYPGHGPSSNLEYERQCNEYMKQSLSI